ncbi:MAG: hypothetical protein HZC54_03955 [Verrucomicrobia bacterium]|nr:hypothetical protein [Verrucomicrobiota bacterium]
MRIPRTIWITAGLAVFTLAPSGRAETGVTNIVDGATTSITGNYSVGTNGSFNTLIVTNGGIVNVTGGNSIVGNSAVSSNNAVFVSGIGSLWSNSARLHVGSSGSFNQLTIANGGQLINNTAGTIGASSGSNSVLVTGAGSLWSVGTALYVGQSGSGNSLTIADGGQVSSASAQLGVSNASANNIVWVTDTGSVWRSGALTVGGFGSGNTLIITNGGQVVASPGATIGSAANSSNNKMLVTGPGSVLSVTNINAGINVGFGGNGNTLTIANGGQVLNNNGSSTLGYQSKDNSVLVTDPGSLWSNNNYLYVGFYGTNNTLTIANGAMVINAGGYISDKSSAYSNSVVVTGPGSVWGNSGDLYVGYAGSGNNKLTITNGGMVIVTSNLVVGAQAMSKNNVTLNGGYLCVTTNIAVVNVHYSPIAINSGTVAVSQPIATNTTGPSVLDVRYGSFTLNSGTVIVDRLYLTNNTNSVFNFNGGLLASGGTTVSNTVPFVVGNGVLPATYDMLGGIHSFADGLFINTNATLMGDGTILGSVTNRGNWMLGTTMGASLTNFLNLGALTINGGAFTASQFTSTNASSALTFNAGTLTSLGSAISNGTRFTIGDGTNAAAFILPSGSHSFADGLQIAGNSVLTNAATLNTPRLAIQASGGFTMTGGLAVVNVVTNAGVFRQTGGLFDPAFYDNTGTLQITGGTNQDTVFLNEVGAAVQHSGGQHDVSVATNFGTWTISGTATANLTNFINDGHATLTVIGGGILNGSLTIGNTGGMNQVMITNGGVVAGGVAILGNAVSSSSNVVIVTGNNSAWNNSGWLYVGRTGSFNQLTITNGGRVLSLGSEIGDSASAHNNAVLVSGAGSFWTNSNLLYVGLFSSSNQLTITDGGRVFSQGANIGNNASAIGNAVLVAGTGSLWTNSTNPLYVGLSGSGNQLIITNGGQVFNTIGYIGHSSSNNTVLVSGAGSAWRNSGSLSVGDSGSGNSLVITNSGAVFNTDGYVGYNPGANGNAARVTGPNSVWSNSSQLFIGLYSSRNSLAITNAGTVFNTYGYIGYDAGATGNAATVTGPGSVWSNSSQLYVGWSGSRNSLVISNAGAVFNTDGIIGSALGANSNAATVTGPGSVWSNSSILEIGGSGSRNSLTITNGGRVFSTTGYIGFDIGVISNVVTVTGSGSVWSNSGGLFVGISGRRSSLAISSGGAVIASSITLGSQATSTGNIVTVSGGNLYATNAAGNGLLDVRRGTFSLNTGTVVVNQLYLTNNASSVMTFSAGLLRSGGSSVSNGVAFAVGDGVQSATLDLLGGTHSFADGLKLSTNASLIGSGDIIAGSATNFGIIAPGHSAGTLSFSGDLTLSDSSLLSMEIGGTATNDYDRVWVGGFLRIGGLLDVTLTNGYTGNAGDTFDLFSFDSLTGTFSQTNLPALGAGMAWNTDRLYTLGEIAIVPEPGAWSLLAMGAVVLCGRRRRR